MTLNSLADRAQFLVKFGYIGSSFYGVQEQPYLNTVLGALRKRIEKNAKQKAYALFVAARTDKGVHALENYATFYLRSKVNITKFIKDMHTHQPDGLFLISVSHASPYVHARGNSQGKKYRYCIIDGCESFDIVHPFIWKIVPNLNIESMQTAAQFLIGEMDYSSFRGGGCQANNVIKTILKIEINKCSSGIIFIEISGKSFLRKMVRNVVGLLVEIGAGLRPPSCIPSVLDEKRRHAAGITAPAQGLFLVAVGFEKTPL
jgi:tRNA pseudouridine38-40 synthase